MAKRKKKYNHGEAFRLMKYVDTAGTIEWIWNSRDGVTPFVITGKAGLEARHEDWAGDPLALSHIPEIGERVFVDLTEARARENAADFVEKFWDDPKYPMSESFPDKDEAVQSYVDTWMEQKGSPDLVVVDQAFQDKCIARIDEEEKNED